jgi:hypothetical protein
MKNLAQQPDVIDNLAVELSRTKSFAELTAGASRLFAANRERLRAFLRQQHPDWSPAQVHDELRRRIHGPE